MIYRWRELELTFELQSDDAEAIRRGRELLSPGAVESDRDPDRRWTIERGVTGQDWRLTGASEDRSLIPLVLADREVALLHVEHDAVDYLMRRTRLPAVHSALLSREGKGVLIVGPSLAGKSTLAAGLWRSGWTLMSDDVAFIDASRRVASPAPRRVSLRFASREIVGDNLWNGIADLPSCARTSKGLFFHPHELCGSPRLRETRIAGVFFLARRGVGSVHHGIQRINPAAAAVALVPYVFRVRNLPFDRAVAAVAPLVAEVPAFDLDRNDLATMVRSVEMQLA